MVGALFFQGKKADGILNCSFWNWNRYPNFSFRYFFFHERDHCVESMCAAAAAVAAAAVAAAAVDVVALVAAVVVAAAV